MTPNDRPANENGEPEPLWENTPLGRRVMGVVSAVVIVAIWGGALLWLDAAHWRTFGIVMGVSVVCMVIAALYRLIVHGRA